MKRETFYLVLVLSIFAILLVCYFFVSLYEAEIIRLEYLKPPDIVMFQSMNFTVPNKVKVQNILLACEVALLQNMLNTTVELNCSYATKYLLCFIHSKPCGTVELKVVKIRHVNADTAEVITVKKIVLHNIEKICVSEGKVVVYIESNICLVGKVDEIVLRKVLKNVRAILNQ